MHNVILPVDVRWRLLGTRSNNRQQQEVPRCVASAETWLLALDLSVQRINLAFVLFVIFNEQFHDVCVTLYVESLRISLAFLVEFHGDDSDNRLIRSVRNLSFVIACNAS